MNPTPIIDDVICVESQLFIFRYEANIKSRRALTDGSPALEFEEEEAIAYTDFEFQNYDDGACYAGQTPDRVEGGVPFCDWDGNTNQFTPQWSASLSADYVIAVGDNLEFRSVLDLSYSDDYFAAPDLDPNVVQDAYTKVNLRLSLGSADGTWDVALVGKNLTDEEIVTFANDVVLSGATPAYFAFVERPRHVAIQGRYRF